MPGGSGRTNFLDLELAPFGVRPKSYFQVEIAGGGSQQIPGPLADAARIARKAILLHGENRLMRHSRESRRQRRRP